MDYVEDLNILRDLYYHLSEKRIFFVVDYNRDVNNRKLVEDYIKDYCEKRGILNRYHYLVDHVWLLRIACQQGRHIQQEEFNGTLGLNDNDRTLKETLENWYKRKDNDWYRDWYAKNWIKYWDESTNKEKFIQEYGQEYIDEIVKEIEVINKERETK